MTAPRLGAGDMVAGKYSIRSHVRDDGTISTHFAADASGREVAIKLYSPDLGARQDVLNALQTVHAKVASLPAELVVPVLDAGVDAQRANALYTVTERVPLQPLPRLGTAAINAVLRSLGRTLEAAHAQGLFHHALSPGNVLVDGEAARVVRVLDFGVNLARAAVPTQAGFAHAAPWMAPEQIDGANAGAVADVFAVGLLAFHMLTGGSFWRSLSAQGLDVPRYQQELRAQRGAASQRASELQVVLPSALDAFFARALALQPQLRFTTVNELAGAFEKAMQNPSVAPGPMKLAPTGTAKFKQTQYAPEPDPTPAPPQNRFKSTQYAPDPQAEMAKAATPSQRPPSGGTLLDQAPIPPLPQHLAGPPVAAAPVPSPQRSWPPPGDVVVPTAAPIASMPPPAPAKSSKAPLIIILLVLLLAAGAGGAYFVFGRGEPPPTAKKEEPKKDDDDEKTASTDKKDDDEDDDQPKKKKGDDDGEKPAASSSASAAATEKPAAAPEPPPKDAAEVTIQCNPACDAVSIDGKALADPVAPVALAAGSHTVVASKAGYKSTTDTFTVKAKTPTTRVYTLVLAPVVAPKPSAKPPCGKFLKKCD